ncbi:DMT family transporter [Bacillus vallismortis]|uniref:DMT family transporter n=1 Tax=Bacillus vallismortis TaxID=72361 RepID=UPI002091D8AF|nr:EamA family transporter [Bacillus vallismortis]MCO4852515.1 EamA family transporter [Bacillus vallismortis]
MQYLAYIIMCFIFGTVFLLTKAGLLLGWPPFLFSGTRFITAGLILVAILATINKKQFQESFKIQKYFLMIGICMTGIPFAAVYWGLQYIDSGTSSVLVASGPLFIFLFHKENHKQKFKQNITGIFLCTIGLTLVTGPSLFHARSVKELVAVCVIILSEIFFAFGSLQTRYVLKQNINPLLLNGCQMFYGGFFLLIISLTVGEGFQFPLSPESMYVVIYFIFIASILSHSLYYWLVQKSGPFLPSTQSYISPFIAIILGVLFLGETLTAAKILSAICILTGVGLLNSGDMTQFLLSRKNKQRV